MEKRPLDVLQYATPKLVRRPPPKPELALALSAPGAMFWMMLLVVNCRSIDIGMMGMLLLGLSGLLSLPCALISMIVFFRSRREAYPWYVIVCLVINASILAFCVYRQIFPSRPVMP